MCSRTLDGSSCVRSKRNLVCQMEASPGALPHLSTAQVHSGGIGPRRPRSSIHISARQRASLETFRLEVGPARVLAHAAVGRRSALEDPARNLVVREKTANQAA